MRSPPQGSEKGIGVAVARQIHRVNRAPVFIDGADVQGAFAVEKSARIRVKGRKLIVVDDVLTSGATADACARVLRRAGAARVDVLVLARVVNFD